ncbi:type I restriction-modification protein subunit S [Mycobacterium gallinarum]|uniref:Type I restriction-modification protein subunit S n=1 Tax=Mycobacterium gallinarum TaxID=39689 RepID=A0A9W4FEP5_9MYCO|nr:restriction endonuclease subunit S [Mycobacterium gallinarum]BBY92307.1 type I restriction-modification protein subunit S [Mycobacterium gallinarum]
MNWPVYADLKESGVEWLGEIPSSWSTSRLGFEAWVRARLGWKGLKADEYVDEGVAFLATPDIRPRKINFDNVFRITEERYAESPEIMLNVGDVLLAKDGSTLGSVNLVRHLPERATVNGSIAVITPGKRLNSSYLNYLIGSSFVANRIQMLKGGMGVPHLFQDDIRRFEVPLPTLSEQECIVTFLDGETAKIDALIDKQEQLIATLREDRTATITHAVTKGLDPAAKMIESDIRRLGKVPAHWSIPQIGMHAVVGNGSTPARDNPGYWSDGSIPWLNSSHVNKEEITEPDQFVTQAAFRECHLPMVTSGSVLVGLTGQGKTRGMASILSTRSTINQHLAYITPIDDKLDGRFLQRALSSAYGLLRELSDENGSTKGGLTCGDLRKVRIPLPPIGEQAQIVKHLAERCAKIDSLISKAIQMIETLHEYRAALITDAVTGKIDVRGVA